MSKALAARPRQGGRRGFGTRSGRARGRAKSHARNSRWIERAGRIGHVAKAVSYALIAVLALQVAFGQRGQTGDRQVVLREVAGQPFGTAALIALAVGFTAYAVWQIVRAVLDRSGDGTDAKGMAKRAEHGLIGVIYLASAFAAVSLAVGSQSSGTSGNEQAETARVLEWPGGRWLVGIVGVGLLAYGLWNVYKAKTQAFRKDLDEGRMHGDVRRWAIRSGVAGHAARGLVFAMVGWFLARAALEYDPQEAVGIDGALAKLADQTYGTWLLAAVAVGLLLYAAFALVQARYRRV
jgi:hypothetical protein